jgi:hypothetical protein
MTGDEELVATLSANTPKGGNLAKNVTGVEALKFDVTAGDSDVTISSIELSREGFGIDSVEQAVIVTDSVRSKVRSFNSDDEATLTFSPALVIKAGETKELTVKVTTSADLGEFRIAVDAINSNADVELETIVSNLFEVKNVVAAKLLVQSGSVNSQVTAGEEQADLYEFDLENNNTNNEDITVSSITLESTGSADEEEAIENLTLVFDNEEIATVSYMNKYVTFNFEPITIEEGKKETFTIKADIIAEAGETISFKLDSTLDVSATSSKYNSVDVVNNTAGSDLVTIQAGELTIYSIDSEKDTFKEDTKDVVFGEMKIVNISGKSLELDTLTLDVETTNSGVYYVLENVELVVNGSAQILDATIDLDSNKDEKNVSFQEDDLGIIIPQGTTIVSFRADTKDDLSNNENVELSLNAGDTTLVINELVDDEQVTDITPNSLSWDAVEFKNASVEVSAIPLANVKVVKGADDIVALQFEVEAGETSDVTLDRLKVEFSATGISDIKNGLTQVALFKGSVSDTNRLDVVSASKLASGVATFDGFEVTVAADETETFIVTLSTADTDDVNGVVITTELNAATMEMEDEDRDVVDASGTITSNKSITVTGAGELELTFDANNEDNQDAKTILAGEEAVVFSVDTIAKNEAVSAETVEFTLSGTTDYSRLVGSAKLYLDDALVATATNSNVKSYTNSGTITFENISNLVFPTESAELRLAIDTETIGYEKIGTGATNLSVTKVVVSDAEGESSGEDVTGSTLTETTTDAAEFAVVPARVTVSVVDTLASGSAKIKLTVETGNNTKTGSSAKDSILVTDLVFSELSATSSGYTIYKEGASARKGTISNTGVFASGSMSTADLTISSNETYVIVPNGAKDTTYTLRLTKEGVAYDVAGQSITTNLENEIDLGTKTY